MLREKKGKKKKDAEEEEEEKDDGVRNSLRGREKYLSTQHTSFLCYKQKCGLGATLSYKQIIYPSNVML